MGRVRRHHIRRRGVGEVQRGARRFSVSRGGAGAPPRTDGALDDPQFIGDAVQSGRGVCHENGGDRALYGGAKVKKKRCLRLSFFCLGCRRCCRRCTRRTCRGARRDLSTGLLLRLNERRQVFFASATDPHWPPPGRMKSCNEEKRKGNRKRSRRKKKRHRGQATRWATESSGGKKKKRVRARKKRAARPSVRPSVRLSCLGLFSPL